ncbi:E-selectin-like, partial [Mercenaria mercenaria]|uniref:E-selectin-like n=1 Tax=Mercenaria mercenaria TaxID=6596 RepID=UPI00234FA069
HLEDSCGTLPNVLNGKITGRKTRDSFMVECNTGYELKGDNPVLCNLSGNWNQMPSCEPIACGVPSIPRNGSICKMKGDGFGATVIMECEEGFYISGNPVVTCSSNGMWTPVPSCEIIASCTSDRANDFGLKNVALGKKVILSSQNNPTVPGRLMVTPE